MVKKCRKASEREIKEFKREYCRNETTRISLADNFDVSILSYEELCPGNTVESYATGERSIKGSFVIFEILDQEARIEYNPVFSESTSRKMIQAWEMDLPRKVTIFSNASNTRTSEARSASNSARIRNKANSELLNLICYARALMISGISNPKPMYGAFKDIYEKVGENPGWEPFPDKVKAINTALSNHLERTKCYSHLAEFVNEMQTRYPGRPLRNSNFDAIRKILCENYPDTTPVF